VSALRMRGAYGGYIHGESGQARLFWDIRVATTKYLYVVISPIRVSVYNSHRSVAI
jgi:hypothetical protein